MEFSFFLLSIKFVQFRSVPIRYTFVLDMVSERERVIVLRFTVAGRRRCCCLHQLKAFFLFFSDVVFVPIATFPVLDSPSLSVCLSNTLHFILSFECVQCINIGLHYRPLYDTQCMYYTMQCCMPPSIYMHTHKWYSICVSARTQYVQCIGRRLFASPRHEPYTTRFNLPTSSCLLARYLIFIITRLTNSSDFELQITKKNIHLIFMKKEENSFYGRIKRRSKWICGSFCENGKSRRKIPCGWSLEGL